MWMTEFNVNFSSLFAHERNKKRKEKVKGRAVGETQKLVVLGGTNSQVAKIKSWHTLLQTTDTLSL